MTTVETKKLTLGKEHDEHLRGELSKVLRQLGAEAVDRWRVVGGSQEYETFDAIVAGKKVTIEAETYFGLTISGDADIVDRIAALVRERDPRTGS